MTNETNDLGPKPPLVSDETLGSSPPGTPEPPPKRSSAMKPLLIGLIFVGAFSALVYFKTRPAPTPEAFVQQATLLDAIDQGAAEGKLVFAVVTADWCPPCQSYKRGALADERVREWLDANAIAVMVDATRNIPRNEAMLLNEPRSIPMTALLRDGAMISSFEGQMSASNLLSWLETQSQADQEANTGG
jgi:thiol:disulfide interchange protein